MAKKDDGKKYIEELLKLVPEDKRAAVQEALSLDSVLETVGDGVLMRSDYSRKQDEVAKKAKEAEDLIRRNQVWYQDNAAGLANAAKWQKEVEELRKRTPAADPDLDPTRSQPAPPDLSEYVKRSDAETAMRAALAQSEAQGVNFYTNLNKLAFEHFKNYGEVLDTQALVAKTFELKKPLPETYAEMTREQSEARQAKIEKDKESALEARIREKIRAEASARGPYPMPDSSEPSTLSGLTTEKKEFGKDAALRDFWAGKVGAAS